MPGRQGSGPLGGGGRTGGGGFGGGGFRGGGSWGGGGYRGGGWGGGYRGGWGGWRPRFFGGWGIPFFFGPRFGGWGGGGLGCGLIALVIIGFIVLGGMRSVFNGVPNRFSNYSSSNGANNGSNGGGLYNQSAPVQTQTAIDLAELHTALDSRIPAWQSSLANNQEVHIPAGDAGMANDNNISDIVYGKCGSAFFVFVVDKGTPTNAGNATAAGYAYTTSTSPATCHPSQYQVTDSENDGGGWYFVYLRP